MTSQNTNPKKTINKAFLKVGLPILLVLIPVVYNQVEKSNTEKVYLDHIDTRIDCNGDDQKCGNPYRKEIVVKDKGKLYIENLDHYNHCSKFVIQTSLNRSSAKLINAEEKEPVMIGYLDKGVNNLEIDAKGIPGGCNNGTLNSWTANLRLYTSKK